MDRSPMQQLSCWEERASPHEHMRACTHTQLHARLKSLHTRVRACTHSLPLSGLSVCVRAPPVDENKTSALTETASQEGETGHRASRNFQQSQSWHLRPACPQVRRGAELGPADHGSPRRWVCQLGLLPALVPAAAAGLWGVAILPVGTWDVFLKVLLPCDLLSLEACMRCLGWSLCL